ncbi:pyrimidine dimer DNA glycosylase/endonuclease V [Georgenia sunbinii]|uniref:pyrimidine dimer DNA glycosylase/endonuclease V n=1 Tax=Georgenia sunbinii TaxID=3117728 RepID=UPI002F26385A
MRIWSLRPDYLDRQGLIACWRETLLAQAVLAGRTRGYRGHSQLQRLRDCPDPVATVGAYLVGLREEATARGYRFDATRIDQPAVIEPAGVVLPAAVPLDDAPAAVPRLTVTSGQVDHEWGHLLAKLAVRSPDRHAELLGVTSVAVHPLFEVVPGPVASWERV